MNHACSYRQTWSGTTIYQFHSEISSKNGKEEKITCKVFSRRSRSRSRSRRRACKQKRTATPPDRSTPITPQSQSTPQPVEETLPKSIVAGMPLPTVDEPQSEDLSSKEFQSISESGVLAESLQRSRQKWISEGIFERYWTKPTKKKGVPAEPLNNPGKDTMTKLGTCQITIEPHVFDATMYAIKEPKTAFQPVQPQPITKSGTEEPIQAPPPAAQPMAPNHAAPAAPMISTPASTSQPLPMNGAQMGGQNPTRAPSNLNNNLHHPPNTAPPAQPNKSTDPVIQMLAERAATDADLKALMRIVANGHASLLRSNIFVAQSQLPLPIPPPTAQSNRPQNPPVVNKPAPPPTPAPAPPQQPQALRSKGPVAPPKPDISGVVFEFNGGNGDRYLFPKYSILDYLPGGQVIASFLIVRKGSSSDSPSYDPQLDYYQPVTIRLYTHQGKQLDSLQKVVAPPDEVRRYMDDIMDNMTRAEYVLLAMRLPKDSDSEKEDMPTSSSDQPESNANNNSNSPLWPTTNAPPPQQ
ncbi:hypothetical protein DID88_007060 [Monilinia fructigena]|uniref:SWR1-complex protein 3 domain-containing protein n=1 Tax=Monilinia fructigena TaxID=38457 RepID=A0A395J7A6_9HELO|nr:hypothetical protein DID88_007060 [Monilinia fructigena]